MRRVECRDPPHAVARVALIETEPDRMELVLDFIACRLRWRPYCTPTSGIDASTFKVPGTRRTAVAGARSTSQAPGVAVPGFVRVRGAREHNLEEHRPRHSARRAGRVHRRVRLREVVARVRHPLRRGAAAISRVGLAVRPAAVPPDGRARRRRDRRPAARGGAAAAARIAEHALVGRQRHHAVEPAAHAVFARRRLPARTRRSSTPSRSRPTPRRAPARGVTGSAASTKSRSARWCRTTR